MDDFFVLLAQQPTSWRVLIVSVLLVVVAIVVGGVLAILELVIGERH